MSLRSYKPYHCSHSHDHAQLVLPLIGLLEMEVGSNALQVGDRMGAYIAPNEPHAFASHSNNLFLVCDLKTFHQKNIPTRIPLTATTQRFIQFTHGCLRENPVNALTHQLMQQLLMHLLIEPFAQDACVERALYWINEHLKSPVSVDDVAQFCHLSNSQLQRRFKQHMGCGVASYWRMKKLQLAKQLLSTSCLSIEIIAYDLGYESPAAFNRRFHQREGIAPGSWRRMHGSAKNKRQTDH